MMNIHYLLFSVMLTLSICHLQKNIFPFWENVGIGTDTPRVKGGVIGGITTKNITTDDPLGVSDWNELWQNGFCESFEAMNAPEPNNWFWGMVMNHTTNRPDYKYSWQIVVKNNPNVLVMCFRSTNKEGEGTWTKVLNSIGNQAINGKLKVKEIKTTSSLTVDFEFEDNYDLLELKFIESYVKESKLLLKLFQQKSWKSGCKCGK